MRQRVLLLFAVGVLTWSGRAEAKSMFSKAHEGDFVRRYASLPNLPFFTAKGLGRVDIGYTFNTTTVLGIPLWNSKPRWCGWVGSYEKYVDLTPKSVVPVVTRFNDGSAKHGWKPITMSTIKTRRDAWHALIKIYNARGKVFQKERFIPIRLKLPKQPPLPFWYRLGGKLTLMGIVLVLTIMGTMGIVMMRRRKR